jgi:predicted small integral membrane protein
MILLELAQHLQNYKGNNMMRLIKILLAVFVALFCIFYAVQNIVNLQAAHGFVAYVGSMADHAAYPAHLGPPIMAPALTWTMLWIIIALEMGAGLLAAKGAYDMLQARNASADDFNAAKTYAIAGCGVAIIVWFGLFSAIAGPYFQMWQTEAGLNALRDSSLFSIQHGVVLLILTLKDD